MVMDKATWAVAIQSEAIPFELELGTATCRCLRQLGHSAVLVEDGDAAGQQADVLLLLVNLSNFAAYCHWLSNTRPGKRPFVILWVMDPLLPANVPREAESIGLHATRWRDRFRLNRATGAMSRWEKLGTAIRLREWAYKQCSAAGYRKACQLIKNSTDGAGDFDWLQVRGVMENWRSIHDAHRNGWVDQFVMSTNQRRCFLASRSIPAHFIPVGAFEGLGRELHGRRDIAVGFLGDIQHGRRAVILDRLERRLNERGIALTRMLSGCYGEKRCEWLNRVRILVNLHNFPWNAAWIRFLMAASCGTLVVSEPMNDEHPMIAGEHYVAATADEMPETILRLLDDPGTISRITRAAADLCRNELSLMQRVEDLTARVEAAVTGEPCPA